MKLKKIIAVVLSSAFAAAAFGGCASNNTVSQSSQSASSQAASSQASSSGAVAHLDSTVVEESSSSEDEGDTTQFSGSMKIALLKGPTGLGAAGMLNEKDNGKLFGNYEFELYNSPDEITGKLISGEIQIAAVPTNVAAVLYNKTGGEIQIAAINTLGTLYVLENGDTITTAADLDGKTIVMAGQGAVPEYVLNYIADKSGAKNVNIEFMPTHAEVASAIASGEADIALLPEPYVSIATSKNPDLRIALDVAAEWDKYSYEEEKVINTLPMGCIVVRKEYIDAKQNRFNKFLDEYEFFVNSAAENPEQTAQYAVDYGIMEDKAIAEKAIPNCSIQYIEGSKMMRLMKNFIEIMNEANPKSIGGAIPGDDFYYVR